jgi:hypothetical protein
LIAGDADDVILKATTMWWWSGGGGLAAVGDDGEQRRYHGTVDGVGGEARTQKINGHENVRGAARVCPTASEDVGSVEMNGGAVGATVVDSGGGGSGEG